MRVSDFGVRAISRFARSSGFGKDLGDEEELPQERGVARNGVHCACRPGYQYTRIVSSACRWRLGR